MDNFSFLFLIFCGLAAGLLLFNAAYDNLLGLLFCFAAFVAITQFGFNYDVFNYARNNLGLIGVLVGLYLTLGIIWAFFRWWKFVKDRVQDRNSYINTSVAMLKEQIPDQLKKLALFSRLGWEDEIRSALKSVTNQTFDFTKADADLTDVVRYFIKKGISYKPQIADYKNKFIGWFLFWPFSLLVFFLNDFMREAFETIYYFFARKLQSISDKIWNS